MKIGAVNVSVNGVEFPFHFREDSVGDRGVVKQIFLDQDYSIEQWEQGRRLISYHQRKSVDRPSLIVDAGANIGASVAYFSKSFPGSLVFSVEPDLMNWHLLEINSFHLGNVYNFNGAIADVDGDIDLVDPGRSDWGFMTAEAASGGAQTVRTVKSISPGSILSHPFASRAEPLILKIDIEGGEEALFRGDVSWLNKFPLVIIELHDWMLPFSGSSRNFLKAVVQFDFDLVHRGENIFLFNRALLGDV